MSITALIHTRNEKANLPDCLRSVAWADEVVVADMASTDGTREIAASFNARVIDMPLAPIVEPVRNLAISQCTSEWILIVDADERIPAKLATYLQALTGKAQAVAYAVPRRNFFLGEWLEHGFWPDYQTRFFRKGAVVWSDLVHELPAINGKFDSLPADPEAALEHPGYGNDLTNFIQKLVKYAPLDAERLANTLKPPIWPYLVRRPAGELLGRYIRCGAWRHGMHGLVWSLLLAQYQLLIAVHYWAKYRNEMSVQPPETLRRQFRWEALREAVKWWRP